MKRHLSKQWTMIPPGCGGRMMRTKTEEKEEGVGGGGGGGGGRGRDDGDEADNENGEIQNAKK